MRRALGIVALVLLLPRGALAQPRPPEWAKSPASFSGTDLLPPPSQAAPSQGPTAVPVPDERSRMLEARVDELDVRTRGTDGTALQFFKNLTVSGYVQPQLLAQLFNAAASPNLQPTGALPPGIGADAAIPLSDGTTTNRTAFRMRRARLQLAYTHDYARIAIEIEPFVPPDVAPGAPFPGLLRTTEVTGIARFSRTVRAELTAGLFRVPFGGELIQSSADRRFLERSWGAQNMFPGSFDTGARARLLAFDDRLDVTLAFLNGHTLGERTFALAPDLNRAKDTVLRAAWDFGPLQAGTSGYLGAGQVVDAQNLRLKSYTRVAWNLELGVKHPLFGKSVGDTKVFAELVIGQNMDRGVWYPSLAPQIGAAGVAAAIQSRRQISAWGRIEQDVGQWFTLGARVDRYDPDMQSGGGRVTLGASVTAHFTKGILLLSEASHAWDDTKLFGPSTGQITTFSTAFQGRF